MSTIRQNSEVQNNWAKDPRCVLLLHMDGENNGTVFRDSSPSAKTVTVNGDTKTVTATKRFGNASAYFDGTGDYLTVPSSSDWEFGNGNFTIMWWAYYPVTPLENNPYIVRDGTSAGRQAFLLGYRAGTDELIYMSSNGSSWDIASGRTFGTYIVNSWQQFVLSRSGTTFKAYRNGVLTDTWESSASLFAATCDLSICRYNTTSSPNLYIDSLAIWKGVAIPIEQLYPQRAPLYDYAVIAPQGV